MNKKEWKQFVLRFLKENNVFSEYMKRSKEHFAIKHKEGSCLEINENNIIESLFDYLSEYSMENSLIEHSFSWKGTLAEQHFWNNLNIKFSSEYNKLIEQKKRKEQKNKEEEIKGEKVKEQEKITEVYERIMRNSIFGYGDRQYRDDWRESENNANKCILEWWELI